MADDPEVKIKISTELEENGNATDGLLKNLEKELNKATAQFTAITAKAKEFGQEVENIALSAEMTGSEEVIRKVADALGLSAEQVKALGAGYSEAGRTIQELSRGFATLSSDIASGATSIEKADGELRGMLEDSKGLNETLGEMSRSPMEQGGGARPQRQ